MAINLQSSYYKTKPKTEFFTFGDAIHALNDLEGISIGEGSVTSVAMTVPSIFNVAGSPITDSGTLAVTLATQATNLVFAGPSSGGAATPTFRALVTADMPSLSGSFWQNGGNSFGGGSIGNIDNQPLQFRTNNLNRGTILSGGNWGIGNGASNGATTATTFSIRSITSNTIGQVITMDGNRTGAVDNVCLNLINARVTDGSETFKNIGLKIQAVGGSDLENDGILGSIAGIGSPLNYGINMSVNGTSDAGQQNYGGSFAVTNSADNGSATAMNLSVIRLGGSNNTNTGLYIQSAGATTNLAINSASGSWISNGTTGETPTSGAGTRMMWIPSKSAFRAGVVTADLWDDTNIGVSSFASGVDVQASGPGSFSQGQATGAGTIIAGGIGSFGQGSVDTAGTINSAAQGSMARGYANSGTITASGYGSMSFGLTTASGAITVSATATGGFAYGTASASTILADNVGAFAGGSAASNGTITSSYIGTFAQGVAESDGQLKAITSRGAMARGCSVDEGIMTSSGVGSLASGTVNTNAILIASGNGSHVMGSSISEATLSATSTGSFAGGAANNSNITSSGAGSFAFGITDISSTGITVSGLGSFGGGYNAGGGSGISVTGNGSMAWGTGLTVSVANAYAFGTGFTNSVASSFSIGFGAKDFFISSGLASLAGDLKLTTAGNKIFIKEGTNGSVGQTTLVGGTKAITISGVTTSTRAFVTLVSPSGVTLTTTYQAVCTANTLTIRANVAAGTINASDISVLNYVIIEPA